MIYDSGVTLEQCQQGLDLIAKISGQGADPNTVRNEVALLNSRTESFAHDDPALRIIGYTSELSLFPTDIIVIVLRDWGREQMKWPPLAALLVKCREKLAGRQQLAQALRAKMAHIDRVKAREAAQARQEQEQEKKAAKPAKPAAAKRSARQPRSGSQPAQK